MLQAAYAIGIGAVNQDYSLVMMRCRAKRVRPPHSNEARELKIVLWKFATTKSQLRQYEYVMVQTSDRRYLTVRLTPLATKESRRDRFAWQMISV